MQYCRFVHEGRTRYGLIENQVITRLLPNMPHSANDFGVAERCELPLDSVRLLAPVEPTKVVCIGRNYREHAKELNNEVPAEPLFFLKPASAVIGPGDEIRRPTDLSQRVDHEGELAVVIGRRCYRLGENDDIRSYIAGYTCLNDVTARDLQKKDNQWSRAKGFDTFSPVGPIVASGLDPWKGMRVQTHVNGELRQDGTTADFIFPLDVLMRYVTSVMTLEPGDVIATGTPAGVSPLQAGDVVEITVEGIGTLRNPVVDR